MVQYLSNNMKNDKFILFISRECEQFFKDNDIQVSQLHKLKKGKKEIAEARLKAYEQGIANETLSWMHANCETLGIE